MLRKTRVEVTANSRATSHKFKFDNMLKMWYLNFDLTKKPCRCNRQFNGHIAQVQVRHHAEQCGVLPRVSSVQTAPRGAMRTSFDEQIPKRKATSEGNENGARARPPAIQRANGGSSWIPRAHAQFSFSPPSAPDSRSRSCHLTGKRSPILQRRCAQNKHVSVASTSKRVDTPPFDDARCSHAERTRLLVSRFGSAVTRSGEAVDLSIRCGSIIQRRHSSVSPISSETRPAVLRKRRLPHRSARRPRWHSSSRSSSRRRTASLRTSSDGFAGTASAPLSARSSSAC